MARGRSSTASGATAARLAAVEANIVILHRGIYAALVGGSRQRHRNICETLPAMTSLAATNRSSVGS